MCILKSINYKKAKNAWVRKNVYQYGISCKRIRGGSFYITREGRHTCYFDNVMDDKIEQLKERASKMSFAQGFWFLKEKAAQYDFNFNYKLIL